MNTTVDKPNGLPRSIRLIKSAEFGAVLSVNKQDLIRAFSDFFAINALKTSPKARIRFGFTVGKHNARLSVERALVKRLLREKARTSRLHILDAIGDQEFGLDITLRLRRKLPDCSDGLLNKKARKELLRNDIDKLMDIFLRKVSSKGSDRDGSV